CSFESDWNSEKSTTPKSKRFFEIDELIGNPNENTYIPQNYVSPQTFASNTHQAKIYTVNGGVAPGQNQPDWLGSTITRAHWERAKKKKKKAVGPGTKGKSLIQVCHSISCQFTCLRLDIPKKLADFFGNESTGGLNLQDFDFPEASNKIKSTSDGKYMIATGTYKPRMKVDELDELALKFDRVTDSENVNFCVRWENRRVTQETSVDGINFDKF
ncbi:hypothetical protein MJO29_012288, partial [Puccinia striiformis f. sp. tritici]